MFDPRYAAVRGCARPAAPRRHPPVLRRRRRRRPRARRPRPGAAPVGDVLHRAGRAGRGARAVAAGDARLRPVHPRHHTVRGRDQHRGRPDRAGLGDHLRVGRRLPHHVHDPPVPRRPARPVPAARLPRAHHHVQRLRRRTHRLRGRSRPAARSGGGPASPAARLRRPRRGRRARPTVESADDGWSDSILAANTMSTRWFDGETDLGGTPAWTHLWDQCFGSVEQYEAHRRGESDAARIEAGLAAQSRPRSSTYPKRADVQRRRTSGRHALLNRGRGVVDGSS